MLEDQVVLVAQGTHRDKESPNRDRLFSLSYMETLCCCRCCYFPVLRVPQAIFHTHRFAVNLAVTDTRPLAGAFIHERIMSPRKYLMVTGRADAPMFRPLYAVGFSPFDKHVSVYSRPQRYM